MAKYGNWFENAQNVLAKIANINTAGTIFTGGLTGNETTYVADGAIAVTDRVAILNSTSATTDMTLADGTYVGQQIIITCLVSINSCTVTIADPISSGSDVITLTTGDGAILTWTSSGWSIVQGITVA
jgi:hypothetical protein